MNNLSKKNITIVIACTIIISISLAYFLYISYFEYETIADDGSEKILSELWNLSFDAPKSKFAVDNEVLYLLNSDNMLYEISIADGELLNTHILNSHVQKDLKPVGIDVLDGTVAINYKNSAIVYNTKSNELICDYVITHDMKTYLNNDVYLHENILILSARKPYRMLGVNYLTSEIEWEKSNDKDLSYSLMKFDDRYLFRNDGEVDYFEYDPLTGELIAEYLRSSKEIIKAKDIVSSIPKYESTGNDEFDNWLISSMLGLFNRTLNNDIYCQLGNEIYFFGRDTELDWKIRVKEDIYLSENYGNYLFLTFHDGIQLLDLESQSIVWEADFDVIGFPMIIADKKIAIIATEDGEVRALSLSDL